MTFTGNLYYKNKPLVLSYQLMESRLKRPRLTPAQRAEYTRQLKTQPGYLTIADKESDEPLLIHFRAVGEEGKGIHQLRVATEGRFYGYFLSVENVLDIKGKPSSPLNGSGREVADRNVAAMRWGIPTDFSMLKLSDDVVMLGNVTDDVTGKLSPVAKSIYVYSMETRIESEHAIYFSDTFVQEKHALFDPHPVALTIDVIEKDVSLREITMEEDYLRA